MKIFLPLLLSVFLCTCGSAPATSSTDDAATQQTRSVYEDLSPEEFAEKIGDPNTVLLDVRTPGETARGVIDGALELDYRSPEFATQLQELDPTKTYLVYCASGGRSGKACKMMDELGFNKSYNLVGGYSAWVK
ncbi:rhodanese-like domain-containing protein [Neolewinella agarilytica]|uniref:Rhodanese-related sulfurtransferase n=1 Tax=Neolewinella agarilytica TaxID=478744 RepID=A0A1H9N3W1_9BACT|nr:rhodanese-like domain-containing protein [Neolewinella agarilytica]SER30602.1 Rhodanese-related sulfurtransferase [Neolewinella agarilytica]